MGTGWVNTDWVLDLFFNFYSSSSISQRNFHKGDTGAFSVNLGAIVLMVMDALLITASTTNSLFFHFFM